MQDFKPGSDGAWLPLREASKQMGVSPQTLRLWADEGRVPSYRTPGGHRRFQVGAESALPRQTLRRSELRWRLLEHSALGRIRLAWETKSGAARPMERAAVQARLEHRELGRTLIGLLVQGLEKENAAVDERADALGKNYAALHRRISMDEPSAVAALGFFRTAFLESVIEFAFGLGDPSPDQLMNWVRRVNEMIDRVCVSMLESTSMQETDGA